MFFSYFLSLNKSFILGFKPDLTSSGSHMHQTDVKVKFSALAPHLHTIQWSCLHGQVGKVADP